MAYQNPTTNGDIYTRITDRIVASIEADGGAGKWTMPWHKGAATGIMPRNAITGHEYHGVNVVVLWCIAEEHGYASGQWATFRQWKSVGASVRKGERAAPPAPRAPSARKRATVSGSVRSTTTRCGM